MYPLFETKSYGHEFIYPIIMLIHKGVMLTEGYSYKIKLVVSKTPFQ